MEPLKIPNFPLTMPQKDNLYRKPKFPYPYSTHGIIRGKEFENILEILFTHYHEKDKCIQLLDNTFGYHVIKDMFPDWNLQEVADFARHTLIINKDAIGWDRVDNTILKLNNIAIPGWRLPNFDFIVEFGNVLNQIQRIYFPERLRNVINTILEISKKEEIQFEKEVKTHLHLWSVRDLWLLLSYLTKRISDNYNSEGVKQIINLVSNKFEELIEGGSLSVKQKTCMTLLYIDAMDGMNKTVTMRSKQLIDQVWEDIKSLPYSEKISFKYLLGAAYSIVGQHLFKQDTDFVTRKLFIDNFIQNYVSEDYDLGRWFADLLDYELNELIFDLLIRGYSKTIPLLHQHAIELPQSRTKSEIELRIEQLNGVLADILIYYLEIPKQVNQRTLETSHSKFIDKFDFDKTRINMLELLYRIVSSSVLYNRDFSENKHERLAIFTSYLLEHLTDDFRSTIFQIDHRLNRGSYQFKKLFNIIMLEVEESKSLVLSSTFENEIIQKISSAIAYTDNINTREDIYLDIYEIILQFLLEWLAIFTKNKDDFKEVLLLLSPLINICFFQQIRWYYENNFHKKAFLMNVNLHSFMNYFSHQLERFEELQFDRIPIRSHKGISEKYKEITEKWEVRDLLDQIEIKRMIIETREKFKNSGLNHQRRSRNLVEDELIHGYLEEINRLEHFISMDLSESGEHKLEEILLDSGIYQPGNTMSSCRLERIGAYLEEDEVIPVPLFNNIHKLSVATELFKLKDKSINSLEKRNKTIQKKFTKII